MTSELDGPARLPVVLGRGTWVVVVLVFVGLLGGTHPSDATRDVALGVAAAVIVALNVPVVVQLVRRRGPRDARALAFTSAGLVLRLAISAVVLALVGSISHEERREAPDSWDSHDAWRRCRGAIAAWPREPAPGCRALHMCANEAPLAADERARLAGMIDATPGCAPP